MELILLTLAKLWRRLFRISHFRPVVVVGPVQDAEQQIGDRHIVLVGDSGKAKWLKCLCPCGCGSVLNLNLMRSHVPHWSVEVDQMGEATVHPSIDTTTCRSHFWIVKSRIRWV